MEQKELFAHFYQDVYRTCYYMLQNQHDAEDICQEVFIKILQQDYNQIANLKPWILSIAMNVCRNYIRKHSRVFVGQEFFTWLVDKIDPQRVEELIELKDQRDQIALFIHKLKPKIREVIILKYLHECKNEEIASMIKIPLGTVKSRASKGILELRKIMESDYSPNCALIKEVQE
jgi:RNA polymerase sigma factor (sigma-70 family)